MKICSANLRNANADDGNDSWSYRHASTAHVLTSLAADVIGVQECMDRQLDWLRDTLTDYAIMPGLPYGNNGPYEYAALAIRRSMFTVTQHGNCYLSETPHIQSRSWDCNWARVANWVVATHIPSGHAVCICNTHLDHLGAQSRYHAIDVIAQQLTPYAHIPTIIMGDFNVAPHSPPHHALLQHGFIDSWTASGHADGAGVMTFHGFKGDIWPSISGEPDNARIDWICARDAHHLLSCRDAAIVKTMVDGRYPSDHYFVTATYTLT